MQIAVSSFCSMYDLSHKHAIKLYYRGVGILVFNSMSSIPNISITVCVLCDTSLYVHTANKKI